NVTDGGMPLFSFTPDHDDAWFSEFPIRASRDFPVRNRTWRLTVVPRQEQLHGVGWIASLPIFILEMLLSVALAILVHVLLTRMELFRSARDKALSEIAERRKAESALDATRSRYQSVFESTTDGMIILDRRGGIVEANAAACTMHGYGLGELDDLPIRKLIAPDRQDVYDRFSRALERTGTVRLDSVGVRKDGSTFDVEVRGTDFQFGGEPRVLAVLTDVSERKHAEERLAQLSRKVLLAQEEERLRLSRDLHDELGQLLTAQHLELDWLKSRMVPVAGKDPVGFENAVKLVEDAARDLRRICKDLRPPLLDDLGIEPAVGLLVQEFEERTSIRTDLAVQMLQDPEKVPPETALSAYRVLQESLTNVSRHSDARNVDISLQCTSSELMLSVYDDGKGFVMNDEQGARGSGITGMHERAHLVGGTIEVRSAPSEGTRVVLRAPLGEEKS
ncbi:MAG: PAS domain S-box protein, partial [Deltaproteobacteria bacterium]|nr:PAS domain S-box protein [Deltaproteobacteria bacterium]